MSEDIRQIATRVRRATANRDVVALCDYALRITDEQVKFDRRAYQKEYMRKWRANKVVASCTD